MDIERIRTRIIIFLRRPRTRPMAILHNIRTLTPTRTIPLMLSILRLLPSTPHPSRTRNTNTSIIRNLARRLRIIIIIRNILPSPCTRMFTTIRRHTSMLGRRLLNHHRSMRPLIMRTSMCLRLRLLTPNSLHLINYNRVLLITPLVCIPTPIVYSFHVRSYLT